MLGMLDILPIMLALCLGLFHDIDITIIYYTNIICTSLYSHACIKYVIVTVCNYIASYSSLIALHGDKCFIPTFIIERSYVCKGITFTATFKEFVTLKYIVILI